MYYDDELNRKWLQAEFLAVVGEIVPDVCPDLYGEPFRLYKEVAPFAPVEWDRLQSFDTPQIKALCNSVEEWANRWNLTADWCKDAACFLLYSWTRSGTPGTAFPHPGYKPDAPDALVYFMERYPPPEGLPTYEHEFGREEYFDRIRKAARKTLREDPILRHGQRSRRESFIESIIAKSEEYCDLVETEIRGSIPKKRQKLSQHLTWAVRFHVKNETLLEISGSSVSEPAVSMAVNDVLDIIGLKSRAEGKRGRIHGSKSKRSETSKILRNLGL